MKEKRKMKKEKVKKNLMKVEIEKDNLMKVEEHTASLNNTEEKIALAKRRGVLTDYLLFVLLFTFLIYIMAFVIFENRGILILNRETLELFNFAINAIVFLIPAFLIGSIGAITRFLFSSIKVRENIPAVLASGLFASFSWVSIKSKLFMALVLVNSETLKINELDKNLITESDFYSMFLLALLVGMFASNFYFFINNKVEHVTNINNKVT